MVTAGITRTRTLPLLLGGISVDQTLRLLTQLAGPIALILRPLLLTLHLAQALLQRLARLTPLALLRTLARCLPILGVLLLRVRLLPGLRALLFRLLLARLLLARLLLRLVALLIGLLAGLLPLL